MCWQVECMKRHSKGERNTEYQFRRLPKVSPRPIIYLKIEAKAHENKSHHFFFCSLNWGELSTMLTTPSPCFYGFWDFFMQQTFILVVEWKVDDLSWAAINKITAQTGSYIPLIHHLLPVASCHTLSLLLKSLRETLGKSKAKNSVMEFWLAIALWLQYSLVMRDSCKEVPCPRQQADVGASDQEAWACLAGVQRHSCRGKVGEEQMRQLPLPGGDLQEGASTSVTADRPIRAVCPIIMSSRRMCHAGTSAQNHTAADSHLP